MAVYGNPGGNSSKVTEVKDYPGPFISIKQFIEDQKTTEDKAKLLQSLKLEDRAKLYSMPLEMSWEDKMRKLRSFTI